MSALQTHFVVTPAEEGQTLAALARAHGFATTWSEARRLATSGKLFVDGEPALDPATRPAVHARIELNMRARKPPPSLPGRLVFDDAQVVVIDKPAGISSVPYRPRGATLAQPTAATVDEHEITAMDLLRAHWRAAGAKANAMPLHVVHRIDKETSGLLAFAKTKVAERVLAARFRTHEIDRSYLCVVHGRPREGRIESLLVADRGDGLRGSTRNPQGGKRAVTHVKIVGPAGPHATLCEVRLETGKTHQIRIHLAEQGHPLVGERVYVRDYQRAGHEPLPSPRLLLHAATLGFDHPLTGEPLRFESPLPDDFRAAMAALGD